MNNDITPSHDKKLLDILATVIDTYINKGEPIWSKYLHKLDDMGYAPSTLRKYLNALEKGGYVYQPYNSSGRIPTVTWMTVYLDTVIQNNDLLTSPPLDIDLNLARGGMQQLVNYLAKIVDGVSVGFLRNDEYYYLWITNILKDAWLTGDFETTRRIVDFIETREIIWFLSSKVIKKKQVYYTFITNNDTILSCLYAKVTLNDYDAIIAIVGPMRVNYKQNLSILQQIVMMLS